MLEAKTHLSRLVKDALDGKDVVIATASVLQAAQSEEGSHTLPLPRSPALTVHPALLPIGRSMA